MEQLANGQVLGTVMLHIDLYSDSNLEDVAEQILADTGLSNVSLSPNAAYDSTMNQNINRGSADGNLHGSGICKRLSDYL